MLATDLELSALTLDEILSDRYVPLRRPTEDPGRVDRRLKRWCDICADGDWDIFRKRLLRDGLALEDVRARLGGVDRHPGLCEPSWVADCRDVLRALKNVTDHDVPGVAAHAFGPVLAPLVASAIAKVGARNRYSDEHLVSDGARGDMVRHLWQRLVELCGLPLYHCLADWRRSAAIADGTAGGDEPGLSTFVCFMRAEGFNTLFASYPSLLRLLADAREQWVGSYAEFIDRLAADRAALAALEPSVTASSILAGVSYGLSDPHDGGRSVLVATFGGGSRVVYKPKPLLTEQVIDAFLKLVRERGFGLPLRIPRVLARDGYGWTTFIEADQCRGPSDVDDYFSRAGAWLGFFHLLSASDMHMENLLASGADPIPVDFETIFQGLWQKPKSVGPATEATWLVSAALERSVLTVGLLPLHVRSDDHATISVGGLEPSTVRTKRVTWRVMNTLRMRPEMVEETQTVASNLPSRDGKVVTIEGHREALVDGFRRSLEFARSISADLMSFVERTARRDLQVRRVFRPTRFYHLLLRRLSDHRTMSDSVTWSMQTEFIARLSDWENDAEETWKLFASERAALTRLTIPAFHVAADGTVVTAAQREITNLPIETGARASLDRIASLSDRSIAEQTRIVETSLQMERSRAGAPRADPPIATSGETESAASLDLPDAIRRHLCERALMGGRAAAWLSLEYLDHQTSAQLVPMGFDLYNGSCGVAIFFAAFSKVRGSSEAADMARASVAQVKWAVRSANRKRALRSMGPGGGVGIGSIVYGLATVAELLDDADALDAAMTTADLLTDEAIRGDAYFDLIGGVAGTCLALLKLHRITGKPALLDRAVRCADHLEANRPLDGSLWSSAPFEHRPLTGVSHGAAGYGLALSRLFAATGVERYRQAARFCVAFEDSHYDGARRNWPDLRTNPETGKHWWPVQWCYGAPGIGHARIAMAADGSVDPAIVERDVRNAAAATLAATPYSNDTLCCGVAGQADFLLEAGRHLGDRALENAGADRMAEIGRRWSRDGDAHWDMGTKEYNLGLFRGVAGIGYAALRAESRHLPKVLVWS